MGDKALTLSKVDDKGETDGDDDALIRSIIKVLISISTSEISHNDLIIRLEFKTR